MFEQFLEEAIARNTPNVLLKKAVEDAIYQKKLYTGTGQDEILTTYRTKESDSQKLQRKRITITRTKHVVRQIENVLNQLDIMDKPAVSIITPNEKNKEYLEEYIYNNNLSSYAFDMVKYYNLIDANTYLCCRKNKYGDIEFKPITSENIYDVYSVNGVLKAVIFKFPRENQGQTVYDYEMYTGSEVIIYTAATSDYNGLGIIKTNVNYYVETIQTSQMFAFPLGYTQDTTVNIPTYVSILEAASELFKSLIWQGSELDVDIATHGILQKFAYAKKCNYQQRTDNEMTSCAGGYLYKNNMPTGTKCHSCNGTGLQIHTSSQDIITYPMPDDPTHFMRLSDLTHIVFSPAGTFDFKKQNIKELQDEIIRTVFNSSIITKDEIAATATEKVIDLQGIYATLNMLGKNVSDCFIWMVECISAINNFKDVEVIHGYTLNLKLESVETLALKRKQMLEANAPVEIIRGIDMAIIQKQHMDSPAYVNRLVVWEQYRPFTDKTDQVTMQILAGLPPTNKYKILYLFWGTIKRNIETEYGDDFFDYDDKRRQEIIDAEVEKIKVELMGEMNQMYGGFGQEPIL